MRWCPRRGSTTCEPGVRTRSPPRSRTPFPPARPRHHRERWDIHEDTSEETGDVVDLVERERSRCLVEDLLSEAQRGNGRAALVVGAPGMGKSALIREVQTRAAESGALVLAAVASGAEQALPMGVVGQLFDAVDLSPLQASVLSGLLVSARALSPEQWATASPTPGTAPLVEGIHRIVRSLAGRDLVVITVDDAHESDAASLNYLLYLVRRVAQSQVLVVLGDGHVAPQMSSPLTSEFFRNPACSLIHLTRLSAERTLAEIAPHTLPDAVARRASGCHRASGGNPLLLRALLEDDGKAIRPRRDDAFPVAGQAYRLSVRYLLNRLEKPVAQVARGLALLDGEAAPGCLDRLLALPSGTATQALDTLDAVGLTRAGRFRLETARTATLEDIPVADRAALRNRAARFLHEEGAPASAVARLLVASGTPVDEDWALRVLLDAADHALRGSDMHGTIACLRAAQNICATDEQRATVRAELAQAEWAVDPSLTLGHLTALIDDHRAGRLKPRYSVLLIAALLWHGQPRTAVELLTGLTAEDGLPPECRSRLRTLRAWLRHAYPALGTRLPDGPASDELPPAGGVGVNPHSESAVLLDVLRTVGPTSGALKAAERLLQGTVVHGPSVAPAVAGIVALFQSARLDRAAEWCELLLDKVSDRLPTPRALLLAVGASVECRRGNHDVARQRAELALSLLPPAAWGITIGFPLAAKVLSCLGSGDRREAEACFAIPVPHEMFQSLPGLHYLQARGRYHLAEGRCHAALGDFYACRELMASWNLEASAALPWRVYAAEALLELDSPVQARDLLVAELAYGESGSSTPCERERAQRLLRRLEPTDRFTAVPGDYTEDHALFDQLTPAEQRVTKLAVQGHTNKAIAECLFVTTSTVEQHLTHAYQKLGVRGRPDLVSLLSTELTAH
ncbi:AAA family ATPase [Streptomyces sp. NPDC019531]|uniref:helix-turn-helix transcriptional regulator n=1 Tax=Streptomyces sp. NPDC019531 TaxID=3365062 RepID=UPI00384E0083